MKTIVLLIMTASLCFVSFPGCSFITVLRTKEMKAESDTLFMRIDSLQSEIVTRQNTNDELLRLIRADLQIRFAELEKKMADLSSGLSESQYRLSRLDEKTADFQKQFQARLEADSLASESKREEILKLFQIAMSDFNAGRFDIAISGFKDLMSRFPDAPEGQEGQYWVAECKYAKKEYEEAVQAYLLYVKQNPQGPKMSAALYKLGLAYGKQNKSKSKVLVWKKLAEQYPDSDEAKLIEERGK